MDPFHERLARVALDVAASYGFALAGGYAVQAHGFLDRPIAIGPVLHADDAVANKVCALVRAEVRDYVDVAAILASGRYSEEDLVRLAEEHDPGLRPVMVRRSPQRGGPPAGRAFRTLRPRPAGRASPQGPDARLGGEDQPRLTSEGSYRSQPLLV